MERERIEGYLKQVAAYRASGQKASQWAAANGVTVRQLASWSAHAARWQARLDGAELPPRRRREPAFVPAVVPSAPAAAAVRVELPGAVVVHWPLGHVSELAAWLHEVAR
jgi:hypothetical protein